MVLPERSAEKAFEKIEDEQHDPRPVLEEFAQFLGTFVCCSGGGHALLRQGR